jgi:hypothetical protein
VRAMWYPCDLLGVEEKRDVWRGAYQPWGFPWQRTAENRHTVSLKGHLKEWREGHHKCVLNLEQAPAT